MPVFRVSFNQQHLDEYLVIAGDRDNAARIARSFADNDVSPEMAENVIVVHSDQNATITTSTAGQDDWEFAVQRDKQRHK